MLRITLQLPLVFLLISFVNIQASAVKETANPVLLILYKDTVKLESIGIESIEKVKDQQRVAYYLTNRIMEAVENRWITENNPNLPDSIFKSSLIRASLYCNLLDTIHLKFGGNMEYNKVWGCHNGKFPATAYAKWIRKRESRGDFKIVEPRIKKHIWFYKKK